MKINCQYKLPQNINKEKTERKTGRIIKELEHKVSEHKLSW